MIFDILPLNSYRGNNVALNFDFDFYIENASQLNVYHYDSTGFKRKLEYNVDYSIHELKNPNGSYITFPISGSGYDILSDTELISLELTLPICQDTQYNNSSLLNLQALEYSFDYLTRICQIQEINISKSPKIKEGSNLTDTSFPYPEANNVIQWDENGEKLINYDIDSKITNIQGVAGDAKTIAQSAASVASCALTNANTAVTKADSAISTANSASSTASTAATNASTALTNSNTAVSTANTAATTATSASNKVDSFGNDIASVISAADKINQLQEAVTTATTAASTASDKADIATAKAAEATTAAATFKQSDWSQTTSTESDYIKNKPTALSSFTDDLGSSPTHTHSQYVTDISGKEDKLKTVNVLSTSGTISLSDNTINSITPTGAVLFDVPGASWNTWTNPVSVGSSNWRNITYGNNKFVAVGTNGYTTTSTSGANWTTPVQVGSSRNWYGIAYGNNKFVAVGDYGYETTSADGATWTTPIQTHNNSNYTWHSVTYANDKFVVVGEITSSYKGYISTSTDGSTWTTPTEFDSVFWQSIVYANNKFVVVGSSGKISTSTDGTTWTTPIQVGSNYWYGVGYGNNKFVAVGYDGYISTSTDGATWTTPIQVGVNRWYDVGYVNNKYMAVGADGYTTTSTDGATWTTPIQVGSNVWFDTACNNGIFVAVGSSGKTMTYSEHTSPITLDNTKFHQIAIQINMPTAYSIDIGLGIYPHWLTENAPDLSNAGNYNLYYEWDNANQFWRVGASANGGVS